jgi:hypothetical protein
MLPIDRTAKATLDANLVNGNTSDAPAIKAVNDVTFNTIDELYNRLLSYVAGTRYTADGGAFTDTTFVNTIDGGTFP